MFKDDFNEVAVGQMFDSQLSQLEKLIDSQKGAQQKMRHMLVSYQKKHARAFKVSLKFVCFHCNLRRFDKLLAGLLCKLSSAGLYLNRVSKETS